MTTDVPDSDRAHAEQRWPYPLPARVFAVIIAGLCVMLVIGLTAGYAIGHRTGTDPNVCKTAFQLLDSPDLLAPGHQDLRARYEATREECLA